MELSWELDQLGRAAAPDTVLEGRGLLYSVADVIRHDDGSAGALVRGDVPQVVALQAKSPLRDSSCTCGATEPFTPCAHGIAVWLRYLQLFHGLDDALTARWARRVESLRARSSAWDGLAMAGNSLGQLVQDAQRGAPTARTTDDWIARSQCIECRMIEMYEPRVVGGGRQNW